MSQRPSGLKPPSRLARPGTGLPQARGGKAQGGPSPEGALDQSAIAAPVDDFKIGDRVWVSGTKPGRIAYLGETQFAPGEWAGVVLDEPVGKNDGSVAGVRYFQCETKRGVFSRVTKLSRSPVSDVTSPLMNASMNASMTTSSGSGLQTPSAKTTTNNGAIIDRGDVTAISSVAPSAGMPSSAMPPPRMVTSTPARPSGGNSALARKTPLTSSQSNLHAAVNSHMPTPISHVADTARHQLRVGERVLVSGSKTGVLRYVGATDFAPGEWAGVELDEPHGKNDGAVAGKRYFDCRPMHGIFSKVNKITKLPSSAGPSATPRRPSASKYGGLSAMHRERSGSQDSVSSLGSSVSTSSRSRVRLGITSLHNTETATSAKKTAKTGRPKTLSLSAENASLQKALKEKEEHIDQLLQERDLERSELARTSAQADNAESLLATYKAEQERLEFEKDEAVAQLQQVLEKVETLEGGNKDLKLRLDEEKRKVEDLQFSVEEATILQDEQEMLSTEGAEAVGKLKEAENKYKKEKERADALETKLANAKAQYQDYKAKAKDAEDTSVAYLDQIEELTHKVTVAETRVKALSEDKDNSGEKTTAFELALNEKNERIEALEKAQQDTNSQVKVLTSKLKETAEELTESISSRQKQQETIDELLQKVSSSETASSNLSGEISQLKSQLADVQRQLESSIERSQQLESDKAKLENQITELMHNSGDSSKQLSLLNEEMLEKERRLQECKTALSDSTREVGKLRQELEEQRKENARQAEELVAGHQQALDARQRLVDDKQSELEKLQTKLEQQQAAHEEEQKELHTIKDKETTDLRTQLDSKTQLLQKLEEDREKSRADNESAGTEKEKLNLEKEKLEKQVKKLESEKEKAESARDEASEERAILAGENKDLQEKHESACAKLAELSSEKEKAVAENSQLEKERDEARGAAEKLGREMESLQQAQGSTSSAIHEKDLQIQDLQEQLELIKTEAECDKEANEQEQASLQEQLTALRQTSQMSEKQSSEIQELHGRLQMVETEREALKLQVNALKVKDEERHAMEKQQENLNQQINELRSSSTAMKQEFSAEKQTMQSSLETTRRDLQEKTTALDALKTEMAQLAGENLAINSYKSTIQGLEMDKKNLQQQFTQLEAAFKEVTNANMIAQLSDQDPAVAKLQEDKEAAEGQIEFLNSVIIDLQNKNSEMTQRVAAMENGGLLNGDSFQISDAVARKPAPRLFCDICDVFDEHDTEDCPTQAMETHGETQYHGDRGQQRPFCDICEIFGHATDECDDEQTF